MALSACGIFSPGVDTGKVGGPSPVDTEDDDGDSDDDDDDGGSGSGSGTGSGSGSGDSGSGSGDSGDDDAIDCEKDLSPPAGIDECVDAVLRCGDSVLGTTRGAANRFEEDAYVSWYCFPLPDGEYAGGEVVYTFQHPGDQDVTITLETPCAELDLAALRWAFWDSDGDCPSADSTLATDCEADDSRGDGVIELPEIPDGTPYQYLVAVEGPEPVDAVYRLTVTCE